MYGDLFQKLAKYKATITSSATLDKVLLKTFDNLQFQLSTRTDTFVSISFVVQIIKNIIPTMCITSTIIAITGGVVLIIVGIIVTVYFSVTGSTTATRGENVCRLKLKHC